MHLMEFIMILIIEHLLKFKVEGFQIIPNPLINVKETSEAPNTETEKSTTINRIT
jgi:hypothetical protein